MDLKDKDKFGNADSLIENVIKRSKNQTGIIYSAEMLAEMKEIAIPTLTSLLNDTSPQIRKQAVEYLLLIGQPAIGALNKVLDSDDIKLKLLAIEGSYSDPNNGLMHMGIVALEPLTKALYDKDSDIRKKAISGLAMIGLPALELLKATLKDEDEEIRLNAAKGILGVGEEGKRLLIESLKENFESRRLVAKTLARLVRETSRDENLREILESGLESRDAEVRRICIGEHMQGLVYYGMDAKNSLIMSLDDPDPVVCKKAAEGLAQIGAKVSEHLIKALQHYDPEVRIAAIGEYSKGGYSYKKGLLGMGEQAVNILIPALKDGDVRVRKAIVSGFAKLGEPALEGLRLALSDPEADVRKIAIGVYVNKHGLSDYSEGHGLANIGKSATESLLVALEDGDVEIRRAAVKGLANLGEPGLEGLIRALRDEDIEVRQIAVGKFSTSSSMFERSERGWGFLNIGEPAIPGLIIALDDETNDIRIKATQGLAKMGKPAMDGLAKAMRDVEPEVRKIAITGSSYWSNSLEGLIGIGEPALDILKMNIQDENTKCRELIVLGLRKIGGPILETLVIGADDPDVNIRWEVFEGLIELGRPALAYVVRGLEDPSGNLSEFIKNDKYLYQHGKATADTIIQELIVRENRKQSKLQNAKNISVTLQKLFRTHPHLEAYTLERLTDLAFQSNLEVRDRAVTIARMLDREAFASLVKNKIDDHPETVKAIMSLLGGSEAIAYFSENQGKMLTEYRAPSDDLEKMIHERWQTRMKEMKRNADMSKWMGVIVFIVGTTIIFWAFILLTLSDQPWQQFSAAIAGIGSFLTLYIRQFWKEPVEQIYRFSEYQNRMEVAFMGYMERVSRTRLFYDDLFLKGEMNEEKIEKYQQDIRDATEQAWRQLAIEKSNMSDLSNQDKLK